MTYVVTDKCINCKYGECVEVCPVDCFYAGENMLVINPEECIDCGVCEVECPIDAITPDTKNDSEQWVELNKKYADIWPNITTNPLPLEDAKKWEAIDNKLQYLSEKPHKE